MSQTTLLSAGSPYLRFDPDQIPDFNRGLLYKWFDQFTLRVGHFFCVGLGTPFALARKAQQPAIIVDGLTLRPINVGWGRCIHFLLRSTTLNHLEFDNLHRDHRLPHRVLCRLGR